MNIWYCTQGYIIQLNKNEIIKLAGTCIELEKIIMSEVNQTQKDKLYIIFLFSTIPSSESSAISVSYLYQGTFFSSADEQ